MKRLLIRISALTVVVVLGLIAIAQGQRGAKPALADEAGNDLAAPATAPIAAAMPAASDPFASNRLKTLGKASGDPMPGNRAEPALREPRRLAEDAATPPASLVMRASNESPTRLDSSDPYADEVPPANDPLMTPATSRAKSSARFAETPATSHLDPSRSVAEPNKFAGTSQNMQVSVVDDSEPEPAELAPPAAAPLSMPARTPSSASVAAPIGAPSSRNSRSMSLAAAPLAAPATADEGGYAPPATPFAAPAAPFTPPANAAPIASAPVASPTANSALPPLAGNADPYSAAPNHLAPAAAPRPQALSGQPSLDRGAPPAAFSGASDRFAPLAGSSTASSAGEGSGRPGLKQLEGSQTPQLSIEKIGPAEVQVGRPATFTVKVRNSGNVAANQVEVHDEVPRGTQLIKTSPSATTGARGQLVWSLGTLKPGDETTVQMEVTPTTEGEIGSVATVQFRTEASARSIATKPALAMKVSSPKQVMIGDLMTLMIEVSNPGTGVASGVVLEEKVPVGLTHVAGPELEMEIGQLKPGESRQIDLQLTAAQAGRITNLLVARGDNQLKVEERVEVNIVAPALEIAMTGPTRRYLERQATYTVSVSNPGTAPAKDIHLTTHLPKGLKFVKANNAGLYDATTHSVAWNLEELPASESGTVTLTALPIEAGEQRLVVQGKAQQGLSDQHEQVIVVEGLAALMFEVADVEDPIEVNGEANYEIRVINQGSKAASNIQIVAVAPGEAKPLSADGPTRHAISGQQIAFEPLRSLAPKADTTFKVKVQGLRAGDLRLKVQLTSDEIRTPLTKEESTRVFADE